MQLRYLTLLVLIIPLTAGEEFIFDNSLYATNTIHTQINIENNILSTGDVRTLEATLYYYPKNDASQTITAQQTTPPSKEQNDALLFTWNNPPSNVRLQYSASVTSNYHRPRITQPIPYPYSYLPVEAQPYLASEDIIRITPDIERTARTIIGEETDAVRAVFKIGRWVKNNVEYDLNTITAEASKDSQWVLDNKQGVCDELTSLFIAMLRSQGIPARFISGVAYTNLASIEDGWGPHGWAEVYLPGTGWVPYDVTYGEYGYIDATHIAFTKTKDSKSNAAEYSMTSVGGTFTPGTLERTIHLTSKEDPLNKDITINVESALENVGYGSYNRIDATITNLRNEYISTELFLADTESLSTTDNSKSILLGPRETTTVHWLIHVSNNLRKGYTYTFPILVYTNHNESYQTSFTASSKGVVTSKESLAITETSTNNQLPEDITCTAPKKVLSNQPFTITCTYPERATLCLTTCQEGTSITEEYHFNTLGAHTIIATAEQHTKSTRKILTIIVTDQPRLSINTTLPSNIGTDETSNLTIHLTKTSVNTPENITITVEHPLFHQEWQLETLDRSANTALLFNGKQLHSGTNTFTITVKYDATDGPQTITQTAHTTPIPTSFLDRVTLWMNTIASWF